MKRGATGFGNIQRNNSGCQILGREVLPEDQVRLRVMFGGREIHPVLKKIDSQWKLQNFD